MASEAGKGSRMRPSNVSTLEWNTRWDAIFNKDKVGNDEASASEMEESTTDDSDHTATM